MINQWMKNWTFYFHTKLYNWPPNQLITSGHHLVLGWYTHICFFKLLSVPKLGRRSLWTYLDWNTTGHRGRIFRHDPIDSPCCGRFQVWARGWHRSCSSVPVIIYFNIRGMGFFRFLPSIKDSQRTLPSQCTLKIVYIFNCVYCNLCYIYIYLCVIMDLKVHVEIFH